MLQRYYAYMLFSKQEGQTSMLQLLLSFGLDVNAMDSRGRKALHMATGGQHLDSVRVLLANGTVDKQDAEGRTAKSLARSAAVKEAVLHL